MKVVETIHQVRSEICAAKFRGQTVGLVPTMGFLHRGHLSLIERAKEECDVVVVSIFVNPLQFGPNEDFQSYPRDLERDITVLESVHCDFVFTPSVEEMYPEWPQKSVVEVGTLGSVMCGKTRPGHFRGVTTVVTKLFHIVQPDKAVFGQKDAQQLAILRQMTHDLNFPITLIGAPIVRESDGLALSSRNTYLSEEERKHALVLIRSLREAEDALRRGAGTEAVQEQILLRLNEEPMVRADYAVIVNPDTLAPVDKGDTAMMVAVAAYVGKTRLIDNVVIHHE